jgi:hypothetical protein
MKKFARVAALVGVAALLPACGGDFAGFYVPFPNTVAAVNLRSSQVVPATASAATGTATITVDGLVKFIDYTVDASGLGPVSAVEIRLGDPGVNGPVLFTIPVAAFPLSGRFDSTMAFLPAGSVTTFAQACGVISGGHAYLVIRTGVPAADEIRGHIGQAALASAALTGAQVPVSSAGSGRADVALNAAQDEIEVTLSVSGLTGITGARIFDGAPGTPGTTPLFILTAAPFTSTLVTTLTSADFTGSAGVATFPDAINALLSGGLFVQVDTAAPELRGQIGPTQLNAALTGGAVFNPTGSAATGDATLALNGTQTAFFVTMTHTVAAADRVNLNVAPAGANGPIIFDLSAIAGAATSPLSATVTPIRLIPNAPANILTFPDAINAILTSRSYVEVGNVSFPGGEIRGQILP